MSADERDRNAQAAAWLERRILEVITETERRFGVYIARQLLFSAPGPGGDHQRVGFAMNVWPESMRIIEVEQESEAIE